ncbi:hypothetical protein B0T17DRAFT_532977 [Bombardia bombarda]|uniref:FAD-binding PCMH-type domain-containing protein n=1 Tax=Bombardia bombarda TaxID=252184 RepID=A0AA39X203_9PEZI|nr:hypothetical protein B0T17DRAFT_532977 [Bombardia bombarda]
MATYAINVDSAERVAAGIKFARDHNIRLTVKNTGHDLLGRSAGKGALELWTHNMKNITFFNYTSPGYKGPAVKLGAGVQAFEAYAAASKKGLRIVGGSCPTVGPAGGFVQGGGHGPLGATYGLGADNALEFEVITTDGRHLTASPYQNSDLYWALAGGGAGNWAVVISLTTKAHVDGRVAGATLTFVNTNDTAFWTAISAWLSFQTVLDAIPNFSTLWGMSKDVFHLTYVTLPGGTGADVASALAPYLETLKSLNVTPVQYDTGDSPGFYEHFERWQTDVYTTNSSQGSRLIPRSTVTDPVKVSTLVSAMKVVLQDTTVTPFIAGISNNFQYARAGVKPGSNAVFPQWRDAIFTINMVAAFEADVSSAELKRIQVLINDWQKQFRSITPGAGSYMNEAIYDYEFWKEDYYGSTYDRLLQIKKKYDPDFILWAHAAVGSDAMTVASDGRLCRVRS